MSEWKPEPGIYYDIPWDQYKSCPYPSPSLLKHGLRSMKRLQRARNGELQPSAKTTAVGQALHCMVSDETERLAIMPAFEQDEANVTATGKRSTTKATSYYKAKKAEWEAESEGKDVLTEVQMAVAKKALRLLHENRKASDLIKRSQLEICVVAFIEGVLTKTRMDGLATPDAWDLKTCPDVEPSAFYRHAKKLGYFFQFALHRAALSSLGYELQRYSVIAVEVDGDYDNGVIDVPMALLDVWEGKLRSVLNRYKQAEATGEWDGIYPAGIGCLEVPNWDMSDDEDIVEWGA